MTPKQDNSTTRFWGNAGRLSPGALEGYEEFFYCFHLHELPAEIPNRPAPLRELFRFLPETFATITAR